MVLPGRNFALAAAAIAACTFGTAGAMIKSLELTPLQIAAFRLVSPVLCVIIVEPRIVHRVLREPRPKLLLASALAVLKIMLWVLGFLYAAISKAIFVLFLWPLFLVALARVFLKEPISKRNGLLLGVTLIGVGITLSERVAALGPNERLGLWLMFGAAIVSAVNMTVFKSELAKVAPREIIFYENLVGAILLGPLLILQSDTISASAFFSGAAYGTIIGFVTYSFSYFALSRLTAVVVAIISYFELVVAVLIGTLYYSEPFSLVSAFGGFLIVASALAVRLGPASIPPSAVGYQFLPGEQK